ncbi:hypothetical protein LUZ63_003959 [Rhynchospora breviuscula]|uniref:Uncharacterized protein n=1 Tax=Rhynchospora breviuscula TaxID=2022672 RepID=A0A9Q0D2D2_9POAL|nr:hypothetical protein LUZ63_003959 [Rhynchospora breviuscula]
MAMANTSRFISNSKYQSHVIAQTQYMRKRKKNFSLNAFSPSTQPLPLNLDYLKREFAGPGVVFEPIPAGHGCSVRLTMDNGSIANVTMPGGMITSYQPQMWHGANMEVLQTMVSRSDDGITKLQGGVSVNFQCSSDDTDVWALRGWVLRGVKGKPDKSIQIEFFSSSPLDGSEARYAVTLCPNLISTELSITNNSSSPLHITGCILNHLKASTPDATYLFGMQRASYYTCGPVMSELGIVPPATSKMGTAWAQKGLDGLFGKRKDEDRGEEREDRSESVHLTDETYRFYQNPPREFTVVDRGRRNSIMIGKNGFDKLYVMSPGSNHDWYGRYAYVCVGPAVTQPVTLNPGDVWNGSQYLYNPNM